MINFDSIETKTETYMSYILEIHIEGEPEWRYVCKDNFKTFIPKEMGKNIKEFLERNRYPPDINRSIRIETYIQSVVTTVGTTTIFKSPYVNENKK